MKKFAAICLLLASLQARGDFVVVEKLHIAAGKGEDTENITLKIKGDNARVDMSPEQIPAHSLSSIINTRTGDSIMLMNEEKTFMNLPGERIKAMMEEIKKMQQQEYGVDPVAEPKITDTGKQEKVGDYNAEIYTAETDKAKFTFWISKEVPDSASLKELMKKLQAQEQMLGPAGIPDITKIEGIPVKMEIVTKTNGGIVTSTVVSVKEAPVADAEFQVPAGYTEGPKGIAPD